MLRLLTSLEVDAVVTNSINAHGFFAKAGPLAIFTSAHVRSRPETSCGSFVPYVLINRPSTVHSQDLRLRRQRDPATVHRSRGLDHRAGHPHPSEAYWHTD